MADLIDRATLGVGKAKPEVFQNRAFADGWNTLMEIIRKAKPVDAVEVVRCKDCIHSEPLFQFMPNGTLFCNTNDLPFPADGFCSRGVRKKIDNG